MKRFIIFNLLVLLFGYNSLGQTQTLGINQTATGNPSNNCGSCYTITIPYSISNINATGTLVKATFNNTVFDVCSYGTATLSSVGTLSTLTFNEGVKNTGPYSVSYAIKFKPGVACGGLNGTLNASVETIQNPTPQAATPLTLTATGTETWAITKYIQYNGYIWYNGYSIGSPFQYTVANCGSPVDVYYHIRVSNGTGCVNLKNSSITDNLPANATVVDVKNGALVVIPFTTGVGTVTFNIGNGINTLDVATGVYDYYIHVTFPASNIGQTKCNTATLNATNICTNAPKTLVSNTECLTLVGAIPGNNCGAFFSPYVFTGSIYQYFIGCPASLNIGLSFQNQCNPSSLTWSNIGYSAPMPGQIHADSFSLAAIPAGKFVTITLNTTTCGTFTQTFTGPMAATNINFYAAPFSIPAICTVTNFAIASNISITGNSGYSFGNLNFTVLSTTWNTLLPVNVGNTVTVNGIYATSSGNYGCNPQFTISAKQPAVELVKSMCNYSDYTYCLNPNDTIVYSLAIQNYGNANLTGASIKDVLPVGLEYIPNTSTFGIYNNYTTCIPANQLGTGISVAHAENSATTNLQWNLPALNATCNTGSNWYVVNFKAKITNAAPAGLLTNGAFCYDASNAVINEPYPHNYNNYSHVYICERKLSLEYRKEVSADSITWDSCVSVAPGSSVYYRLKVKNPGNASYSQLKIIDILPNTSIAGSDINIVNCNVRGSNMPIYLTNYIPLGNASSITYSTSPQPTRGTAADLNLIPDLTIGCNTAPAWGTPPLGVIQNQKSVRIDFGAYVLGAGQTETFTYLAQIPPGATTGMIGWNSFAASAFQGAVQTLGAECPKICVTIKDSGCACIGNFVWMDSNGNGLQDTGEPGINGCTITLFNASNVQIGLPHISANNISGMPGYYSFCGMPAGNYYIVVTPPAGLMLTIQNNSNPPLNSDINPANYTSAIFAFNCQTNNDLDIGLVEDDGCDCKNSSWGNIYISNNVVINPHYEAISKKGKVVGNGGVVGPYNPSNTTTLTCTKQPQPITLVCKTTYNFAALYNCSKPNCGKVNIVITLPNGTTTTTTNTGSFTTTDGGFYTVNIYGMCGNKICDSCKYIFKVVCPICPCDPKLKVTLGTQSIAHITSSPAYTLVGQSFNIATPPGMLYTQVRAEVVGFTLKSDFNNECISCKNLPYTWASIYNASNINTNASVADSITMGTASPVIQFTPSLTNTHQNPRETIWSNYSGFTMPNTMNLQFVLPPKSIITCCKLYGKICVKFTFRDRDCKECEVVICFDYTILPTNGTSNPYNDASIDVANDLGGIKKEIQATKLGCDNCNPTNDPLQSDKKSVDNLNSIAEIKEQSLEATLKELKEEIKQLNELKAKGIKRGVVESLPVLEQKVKELSSLPRK